MITVCFRVASPSLTWLVSEVADVPTDTVEPEIASVDQLNVADCEAVGGPMFTLRAEIVHESSVPAAVAALDTRPPADPKVDDLVADSVLAVGAAVACVEDSGA